MHLAVARLPRKAVVLVVGGLGILPAKGAHLLEDASCRAEFAALVNRWFNALTFGFEDFVAGVSMADKRQPAGMAHGVFRIHPRVSRDGLDILPHPAPGAFSFRPGTSRPVMALR